MPHSIWGCHGSTRDKDLSLTRRLLKDENYQGKSFTFIDNQCSDSQGQPSPSQSATREMPKRIPFRLVVGFTFNNYGGPTYMEKPRASLGEMFTPIMHHV